MNMYQDGHDRIFRLSVVKDAKPVETKYFLSACEALAWRERLEAINCKGVIACAPASAFTELTDAELEALTDKERNSSE